jgi:Putative phage holin Dp-1
MGEHEAVGAEFGDNDLNSKAFWMPEKLYDILKPLCQIGFPGLAVFWLTLGEIWGFENAPEVGKTIIAINTLLGIVLAMASRSYNNSDTKYDGTVDIHDPVDGPKQYQLTLPSDPEDIDQKDQILLKVNKSG